MNFENNCNQEAQPTCQLFHRHRHGNHCDSIRSKQLKKNCGKCKQRGEWVCAKPSTTSTSEHFCGCQAPTCHYNLVYAIDCACVVDIPETSGKYSTEIEEISVGKHETSDQVGTTISVEDSSET